VTRATSEDWNRYYEGARQKRKIVGADPLERYRAQQETREKRLFVGATVLLAATVAAFYSVLIR